MKLSRPCEHGNDSRCTWVNCECDCHFKLLDLSDIKTGEPSDASKSTD